MDSFGPAQGSLSSGLTSAAYPLLAPNGTVGAPSYSFSGSTTDGAYLVSAGRIRIAIAGSTALDIHGAGIDIYGNAGNFYGLLAADAANVLALKNGTTAQTFRVYGTTTGSHYLTLGHTGTAVEIYANSTDYLSLGARNALNWTIGYTVAGALESAANYRFSHGTSALATTATEGFFHIQSCAGAPTGVPASIPTGQIPMVFDTTNSRLYIYHGAAWHYIAQTA